MSNPPHSIPKCGAGNPPTSPAHLYEKSMKKIREIYNDIMNGDPISDNELITIMKHFEIVAKCCDELGDIFYLPACEANRRVSELKGYAVARGLIKY